MTHRPSSLLLAALALVAALFLDLAPVDAHPGEPADESATGEETAAADASIDGADGVRHLPARPLEAPGRARRPARGPGGRDPSRPPGPPDAGWPRKGYAVVAGPFGDQDDERLRGLVLYRVGSVDEARRLAEADPAVQAGRLEVEVMTWYTEKGALAFPGVEGMKKGAAEK